MEAPEELVALKGAKVTKADAVAGWANATPTPEAAEAVMQFSGTVTLGAALLNDVIWQPKLVTLAMVMQSPAVGTPLTPVRLIVSDDPGLGEIAELLVALAPLKQT
ncbi:hypothetical protein CCR94_08060 [Rhodoblastus sphagnicola]|uniref:Uncharacterized protein n=2 Tax=Rhodoblastus sphagnicola TaxID=333368 RepID=A0A2S6NAY2_9HYPH|nr:hypothetical protein CCR94_08060 [Rhodoblastus sphagnicola]